MKTKFYLKRNFYKIRILLIIVITIIMFYSFYFSDKPASINTIRENKDNPMMYVCIVISLFTSLLMIYIMGGFNKENIKRMTTINENEKVE